MKHIARKHKASNGIDMTKTNWYNKNSRIHVGYYNIAVLSLACSFIILLQKRNKYAIFFNNMRNLKDTRKKRRNHL